MSISIVGLPKHFSELYAWCSHKLFSKINQEPGSKSIITSLLNLSLRIVDPISLFAPSG